MNRQSNALESHLFRQFWSDGLLDIFAGAGIAGIGVCWAFDLVAVGAAVPAVLTPLWIQLRRTLVEPRAGLVEFSDARQGHNRTVLMASAAFGISMFVLFLAMFLWSGSSLGSMLSSLVPGLPAFLLALLLVVAGLGLGLQRFFAYAGLLCISGVAVALTGAEPEVAMIGGGMLITLPGAWMLVRFLQTAVETGDEV